MLRKNQIKKAQKLFFKTRKPTEQQLITKFESFYGTLPLLPPNIIPSRRLLIRTLQYASSRLSDLFFRLNQIYWLRSKFEGKRKLEYGLWNIFTALAIKDFHIDITSLMDALAPVIIQPTIGLKKKDQENFPGFSDIQKNSKREYRKKLPPEVINIIDATDRWWPKIKIIRNTLAHREHGKIVFMHPGEEILFQVYDAGYKPKIINKSFLWEYGHNVVNFNLYSAFILAELLIFMEDIAIILCNKFKLTDNSLTPSFRLGDFRILLSGMEQLTKK